MGLFTTALAYRSGKRRAVRAARRDADQRAADDDRKDLCDNCGHRREQHHDDGRCPTY